MEFEGGGLRPPFGITGTQQIPSSISTGYRRKKLAAALKEDHPGASASILEGLEETLTVNRLGLPNRLARSLCSTNPIESLNASIRNASRNVKRWRNGTQALRWAAAALLNAEDSLRLLYGYRDMPFLIAALRKMVLP